MTPTVATSIVPDLGRLACAYFHTSAHLIRQLGRERLIESDVTDPHFIAVRRDEIAHLLERHQNGKPPQTRKSR
jgi:hypothetical protein